jgi:hypothetical protein
MRNFWQLIHQQLICRSGRVEADYAIWLSVGTLCGLVALATVGVMPNDFVKFAIDSIGGVFDLVE